MGRLGGGGGWQGWGRTGPRGGHGEGLRFALAIKMWFFFFPSPISFQKASDGTRGRSDGEVSATKKREWSSSADHGLEGSQHLQPTPPRTAGGRPPQRCPSSWQVPPSPSPGTSCTDRQLCSSLALPGAASKDQPPPKSIQQSLPVPCPAHDQSKHTQHPVWAARLPPAGCTPTAAASPKAKPEGAPSPALPGDAGGGMCSPALEGLGHGQVPSQCQAVAFPSQSEALGGTGESPGFTSGACVCGGWVIFQLLFPKPKLGTSGVRSPAWGQGNWDWVLVRDQLLPLLMAGGIRQPPEEPLSPCPADTDRPRPRSTAAPATSGDTEGRP